MPKHLQIHGFIIHAGKGKLCRVTKPGTIYNDTLMVVIPFSICNIRTTTRRFSNDHYRCIVKGSVRQAGAKADYAFNDSLINRRVKPKETTSGYIRIPFKGRGLYGVRFYDVNNKHSRDIVWPINQLSAQPLAINRDGDCAQSRQLEANSNRKRKNGRLQNQAKNHPLAPKVKTTKLRKQETQRYHEDAPLTHQDGKDMYDFAGEYESRDIEYGHGRRKSNEWNSVVAFDLQRELDNLRSIQKSDPNTFDHGAMK